MNANQPSVPDRINTILARARHHRNALEALHLELSDLMNCEHNSPADLLLLEVVWQGADFGQAVEKIMRDNYGKETEPL